MVRRPSSETPSEPSFDCSLERTWPSTDHDRPLFLCHNDFQSFSTFPLSYRHNILPWMVCLALLMGSLYLSRNLMTLSSHTWHIMVGKLAIALIMSWLSPQNCMLCAPYSNKFSLKFLMGSTSLLTLHFLEAQHWLRVRYMLHSRVDNE